MEVFGARRLADRPGSRYNYLVPCFNVRGVDFLHSGSYYIVQPGHKADEKILNDAMAEFGETHPGGDNFWYDETHSVKGILTFAAMIEGKYTKELVDKFTNETYKKLLECPLIQSDVKMPFQELPSSKMDELRKVIDEYNDVVNPFGNDHIKLKDPIEYLGEVGINILFNNTGVKLKLYTKKTNITFYNKSEGLSYQTYLQNDEKEDRGYTSMGHYNDNVCEQNSMDDEVVFLFHTTGSGYGARPGDIDLRISLKTGLAWEMYRKEQALLATDEQIATMIFHLKISMKKIKSSIISKIIEKN
jgi:hypothetical protein